MVRFTSKHSWIGRAESRQRRGGETLSSDTLPLKLETVADQRRSPEGPQTSATAAAPVGYTSALSDRKRCLQPNKKLKLNRLPESQGFMCDSFW